MNKGKWLGKPLAVLRVWQLLLLICVLLFVYIILYLRPTYQPALEVVGDVETTYQVKEVSELGGIQTVTLEGKRYRAVPLRQIIDRANPRGRLERVLLIAGDGFTAELDGSDLDDCYLTFTARDGWRGVNLNHPISANGQHLQRVVVVTDDKGLTVVSPEGMRNTSVGALYAGETLSYPYREGTAVVGAEDAQHTSTVYTRRQAVDPARWLTADNGHWAVSANTGETILAAEDGLLQLNGNQIDYFSEQQRQHLENVSLVCLQPPAASVSDLYYHLQHYQQAQQQVLLVTVSGLNQETYLEAKAAGKLPYITAHFTETTAYGGYPLTQEAWLRQMQYGLGEEADAFAWPNVTRRQLTLDAATFDKQVENLCAGFKGAVLLAPLPAAETEITYDTLCAPYFIEKSQ